MCVQCHAATQNGWSFGVFVGLFCFFTPFFFLCLFPGGRVVFSFYDEPSIGFNGQQISFYADQEDAWHLAYTGGLTCQERVDLAAKTFPLEWLRATNYTYSYEVAGIIPRWWFIAISNCRTTTSSSSGSGGVQTSSLDIRSYEIHFTNRAGLFQHEFSKDVHGIFEMTINYLVLYGVLLIVLVWMKIHAKSKGMQYMIIKYIFLSMMIQWLGLCWNLIHYATYAYDGIGVSSLESTHFFFEFVSNLILLYVILNISKGWSISTNYLVDRRFTFMIVFILGCLYISLFIWSQTIMDPASVLYIYETPPGWTIVGIRSLLTLYCVYSILKTRSFEYDTRKRQFYLVWLFVATCWLISLPITVGVATKIETWKRQSVVFGIVNTIQAILYGIFIYLFRPFRTNRFVEILQPDENRAFGTNQQQIFPTSTTTTTTTTATTTNNNNHAHKTAAIDAAASSTKTIQIEFSTI